MKALKSEEGAGNVLELVSSDLTSDKELVEEAVAVKGKSLELATQNLKGDKEVVLKAVGANGMALKQVNPKPSMP